MAVLSLPKTAKLAKGRSLLLFCLSQPGQCATKMPMRSQQSIHASCVAVNGKGVLLTGVSGVGKSDLALRLIHEGAKLVADDQVFVVGDGDTAFASPPENLAGLLEVRGMGIFRLDYQPACPVAAVFELQPGKTFERMPAQSTLVRELTGVAIACWPLDPFCASATARISAALSFSRYSSS
jgi:hypothetical protein